MPRTITLNWMDWITLAIVLVSILRGTRYGALAGAVYADGAALLRRSLAVLPASWAAFVALVAIWIGLYVPLGLLVRWALGRKVAAASRMVGGVLGGIRGLVLATILLVIVLAAPFREAIA